MTEITIKFGLTLQDGDLEKLIGIMPDSIKEKDEETRRIWSIGEFFNAPFFLAIHELLQELDINVFTINNFSVAKGLLDLKATRG